MTIAVIASFTVKTGMAAEFEAVFAEISAGVRADEPGNSLYELCRDQSQDDAYAVMELYADRGALERHRQTPHFAELSPKIGEMLAAPPTIRYFDVME